MAGFESVDGATDLWEDDPEVPAGEPVPGYVETLSYSRGVEDGLRKCEDETARLTARVSVLETLMIALRQGDCWCGVGIDNPMLRGIHSAVCCEVSATMGETR